ncbi:MAG: DUF3445 domain-containing protein, partial [Burkholderiales bacterium]
DGEALRQAAPALGSAMLTRGPFERYVWTVADSPALSRHPAITEPAPVRGLEDLYFRCERQVILPLPAHGRALFLIRVFDAPLGQVLDCPDDPPGPERPVPAAHDGHPANGARHEGASCSERHHRLVAALRSMSPATVRYKNLQRPIEVIERCLGPLVQDDSHREPTE